MPDVQAKARMTSTLSAVLHHADGRPDEDLGVISTTEVDQPDEMPAKWGFFARLTRDKGAR